MSGQRYIKREGPGGTRLAGHALTGEGRRPALSDAGTWLAWCECGKTREVASASAAKRWHAQHKFDVANGTAS